MSPNPSLNTFMAASISWHNISVSSKASSSFFGGKSDSKGPTKIIKNVSGQASAGSTLAIMGSSGAGKTTLLNVLTARNLSNFQVEGLVKINGKTADVNTISSMSAYVQQADLFIPTLTVREHLIFQALVRMKETTSDEAKAIRVNEVLTELSLLSCADIQVGGTFETGKGISGGEMKRLAFGAEILTNPSLIFCDEPTSGLDSFMAANLVMFINKMASAGRTIICTIHQPASNVFSLFENLLLMADGRVAFMGATQDAPAYFAKQGIVVPDNYNPAEIYIRQLAVTPGQETECKAKIGAICDYYSAQHGGPAGEQIASRPESSYNVTNNGGTVRSFAETSWCVQMQALAWRSLTCTMREPLLTYVRLSQGIITALVLGIFYYQQKYDQRGLFNLNGALFLVLVNLSRNNALCVINVFCAELPVFLREYSSGVYRSDVYFLCRNLAEFPIFVLVATLYSVIVYYMIGFYPTFDAFLYLVIVGILVSHVGVSFGYLISCLFTNTDMALSAGPPILIPLQLVGGYFINSKTIPSYLSWAQFFSWFYYGFDLLIDNQWKDVDYLDCGAKNQSTSHWTTSSTLSRHMTPSSPLNGSQSGDGKFGGGCLKDGPQVLSFLDLGHSSHTADFGGLVFLFLFFRFGAFLALFVRARLSR